MNKITAIALFSLLSAGAAMADGLSRDDVVAELVRARNAGELNALQSESYGFSGFSQPVLTAKSGISREAVTAELQRARQSGELARRDAESYSPSVAPVASTTTRAQVLAELQAARASGEFAQLNSNNPSFMHLASQKQAPAGNELLAGQPGAAR
jgi:Domain of unknown function (DUF4148)